MTAEKALDRALSILRTTGTSSATLDEAGHDYLAYRNDYLLPVNKRFFLGLLLSVHMVGLSPI
ncbi:MAG: hypothetical protein UY52_C0039G0020 [Parcubacteria group bacterium GW2011_GWC2_49_9]|nr:MAG: hypothetical protein UY52_C0039G0020 [Parcubacteria group bacterium GW2011_GWC2_49_9]